MNISSLLFDILNGAKGVASTVEYWLGIITSFILLFVRHRIKLPKIRVTGSGGGGSKLENGKPFKSSHVHITNIPNFWGYPINRDKLSVSEARIYDPETRRFEGGLIRWEGAPGDNPHKVDIEAGESASLCLYGIYDRRIHHYVGTNPNHIERSETLIEIGATRKLEIHIFDKLRRRYRIAFMIVAKEQRNHVDGFNVHIRFKTTLSHRIQGVKDGFLQMIRAFTSPSY